MHTTHARHSGFVQQLTKGERERRHKLVHSERTVYGHNQRVGGLQTQVSPGFKTTSYWHQTHLHARPIIPTHLHRLHYGLTTVNFSV